MDCNSSCDAKKGWPSCEKKWEKSWDRAKGEKLHLESEADSWGEVRHEPCQLHWHAVVVLMNRFAVLIVTLTFSTIQSHSSYQGPLALCNHFHLPFPKIHMDRNSKPWEFLQPFVDKNKKSIIVQVMITVVPHNQATPSSWPATAEGHPDHR